MTVPISHLRAYERWRAEWVRHLGNIPDDHKDRVDELIASAWDFVATYVDDTIWVDEDGCFQCPRCDGEVMAVVEREVASVPVIWDRKQECFDYSTLDGQVTESNITEWHCKCGFKAKEPLIVDTQTLNEL